MTGLVRLQGSLYSVSSNKRTLRRRSAELAPPPPTQPANPEPGGPSRWRRSSATVQARSRLASAAVAHSQWGGPRRGRGMKARPRATKSCLFFNLFGRCNKMGKGCPYDHDVAKVAVCRRFLRGTCHADSCPFSHAVAPEKMPVCYHFLRGICGRDACPYLHVKVGRAAAVCPDFQRGHCPAGAACAKRHVYAKAEKAGKSAEAQPGTAARDPAGGAISRLEVRPPAAFVRFWSRTRKPGSAPAV